MLNFKIFFNHGEIMITRKQHIQVNLESFTTLNFKIFFNYGEVMIVREYQNQVNLESFGMLNLKIFFNHGEVMNVKKQPNQVNLESFITLNFKTLNFSRAFSGPPWGRAYSDLQTPRSLARPRCSLRSRFNYWRTLQKVLAHIRRTQNMDSILEVTLKTLETPRKINFVISHIFSHFQ